MANPNIYNVSILYGNTTTLAVTSATTNVVNNPINSGYVYRVNLLTVSNISTNNYSLTAELNIAGSNTEIIKNVTIPATSSLTIIAKDTSMYLTENTCIQLYSSQNSAFKAICSYEQLR
jgi:hypothetical protein